MRFPFFSIPKRVTWEELSENILRSIELERQENKSPSILTVVTEVELPPTTAGNITTADTSTIGMPKESLVKA